jgi:hypothetical protein
MTVEDRVRSATGFIAQGVHEVPPLVFDDEPQRARVRQRRRLRMAPLAAAAAVVAIAVALVVVRDARNAEPKPPAQAGISQVPRYYVALHGVTRKNLPDQVVVGDTFARTRLATVSPPAHSSFVAVTGAPDDRTFVLGTEAWPFSATSWDVESRTWYLLRLAPGTDHPARLTRLPIPATPSGLQVIGMALSPDASKFAVALEPNETKTTGPETLRVYSVATGALVRTWTGPPSSSGYGFDIGTSDNTTLFWLADGHTLAFDYGLGVRAGVRVLDTNRRGHNLLADSRAAWSGPTFDTSRPVTTSDGKSVVCFAEGSGAFAQYSTATGQLTRTLYRAGRVSGEVLWASSSGDVLIAYLGTAIDSGPGMVGVITHGTFRKLSFKLASGVPQPNGVAW